MTNYAHKICNIFKPGRHFGTVGKIVIVWAVHYARIFSSVSVWQEHEAIFEHFSGVFMENKLHEQSLEDYIKTVFLVVLQQ